jgi:hypothetical protein
VHTYAIRKRRKNAKSNCVLRAFRPFHAPMAPSGGLHHTTPPGVVADFGSRKWAESYKQTMIERGVQESPFKLPRGWEGSGRTDSKMLPERVNRLIASCQAANESVVPETVESVRCQLSIANGVLDVSMTQIMLNRTGIHALVRQVKPARMTQHMGMDRKR